VIGEFFSPPITRKYNGKIGPSTSVTLFWLQCNWNGACCLNGRSLPRLQTPQKNAVATFLFGVAWTVTVILGFLTLLNYETKPGRVGAVPQSWPLASHIKRSADRPTLVMLAHPLCPCSRASVGELGQIMARVQGKVTAYVIFLKPEHGSRWQDTDLQRSAAAIPGVIVLSDIDGVEARQFGAETSGHTLLFDRDGRLLFSGGITQSRGHRGENIGESSIVSLVNNRPPGRIATFMFGCSLGDSAVGDKGRCQK
jgi:hypothetical protein